MSMKLLSRGETNENNSFNNPKIEGEEQPVNESAFETEYLIEYDINVSTSKNSLAKTYEDKNEMIAILEVPKSDYKNENIQKLLKWARTRVREDNYYRDIAVYIQMAETFERSIVFTHAEISINEETYIKSDFVTMIVRINQKRDKFAGVMFGDNIDDTYRKAWQKVLNPPRLNIYVPVKVNDNKEFANVKEQEKTEILFRTSLYDENNKYLKTVTDKVISILNIEQSESVQVPIIQVAVAVSQDKEKKIIQEYLNYGYRYYANEQNDAKYIIYEKKLIQIKKDSGNTFRFAASGYIDEDRRSCTMYGSRLLEEIGCKDIIKIPSIKVEDHKGRPYYLNDHIRLIDIKSSLDKQKNSPITIKNIPYDDKVRLATIVYDANIYGIKINDTSKVIFEKVIDNPKRYFFYSDGPETIKKGVDKKNLLRFYINPGDESSKEFILEGGRGENEGLVDFEFYHKCFLYKEKKQKEAELEENHLYLCIIIKNISEKETTIIPYESEYFSMEVTKEPEDERDKEIYCADVEKKFLNAKEREPKTLLKNEEYVYEFEFNTKDKKAGYGKRLAEEKRMIRIYGRTRIKCLDNKTIQARVVVLQKEILNENRGKLWEYSSSKIQEDRSQNTDSGQFSGVVGYTELNITVNDMKKGECLVFGDYAQGGDPREANGRNTGLGNPDNKEYPIPLYADTREKYKYFFGNFGIIYNITFKGQESNKLRMYPFGHNYATAAAILIKEGNKGWDVKYLYSPNNDMTETKNLYSKFAKDDGVDKMALIGCTNAQIFPKASEEINIINNKLSYMLSGGNCGCIKFLME